MKLIKERLNGWNVNEWTTDMENLLKEVDNEFGQEEVYMWSTYILPNGHFLNPENSDKEPESGWAYEHDDFMSYSKYGESLFNTSLKMNVTYPYIMLPQIGRWTPEQQQSFREIIRNKSGFTYETGDIADRTAGEIKESEWKKIYDMQEPLMVLAPFGTKVYDLSEWDASSIIKDINIAYRQGFLNESVSKGDDLHVFNTGEIVGEPNPKNVIDTTTTGEGMYRKYLSNKSNIKMMSPREYFEECAKNARVSYDDLIDYLSADEDRETIDDLKELITVHKIKLPIPYIDRKANMQEGRHRLYALAELFGWDTKFPVLVVNNMRESVLQERQFVDKVKLSPDQDRRRKLTDEQKEEIRHKYKGGGYSLNSLAREYGVSKKTILLIVNPESKAKSDARIKAHWRDYVDREELTKAAKSNRDYKTKLMADKNLKNRIQGLPDYTEREILDVVANHIKEVLHNNNMSVEVVNLTPVGSRAKYTAREDSDLDILFEYSGDEREDDLFNVLHEEPLEIEGINIDINPIDTKLETTAEWIKRNKKYKKQSLDESLFNESSEIDGVNRLNLNEALGLNENISNNTIKEILAYLKSENIDLSGHAGEGGKCVKASKKIFDKFGFPSKKVSVFTEDMRMFKIGQHCVNIVDENTLIDFTWKQYSGDLGISEKELENYPDYLVATRSADNTFKSNILNYILTGDD